MADEYTKDPDARLDWAFDWTRWLSEGETITDSDFFASPGITIDSVETTPTYNTVWLTGGQNGKLYRITNRITTSSSRTDDRSITIRVTDR